MQKFRGQTLLLALASSLAETHGDPDEPYTRARTSALPDLRKGAAGSSSTAAPLSGRSSALLAEVIGDPWRTRPHAEGPNMLPQRCQGHQLGSALLSAATVENIALYQRVMGAKFLKGSNLSTVVEAAWRGRAPLARHRVRSCAVVGSSSKLLDRKDGLRIDASDLVIRSNHPPVAPWLDRYVGSRTDVHVEPFQIPPRGTLSRRGEVTIKGGGVQLFTCTSNHDFPGCLGLHSSTNASDGHWDRVAPAIDWYARALMKSTGVRSQNAFSRPTTGFIALLVALHSCDTVTLYGYGMSPKQPCPTYRDARQDAQGGAFLNASHCRGFGEYTRNGVHNYAAEQAWLHAATGNYTRTTLTCEDLPLLVI